MRIVVGPAAGKRSIVVCQPVCGLYKGCVCNTKNTSGVRGEVGKAIDMAWSRLTLSATLRVGKPQNRDAALFINNSKARVSVSPLTKLHAKWGRGCKATCLCMQRVLARQRVTGQSMCCLPTGYGLQLQSCCSRAHGHVCAFV